MTLSNNPNRRVLIAAALLIVSAIIPAQAQQGEVALQFTPAQTKINFTLDATMHSVHGSFDTKSSTIHFNPASGVISGEIVVDAASSRSGNGSRDSKMHKDILENARYREITFLPDRVEGKLALKGKSTLQVHGMFGVHGAVHEITIPVDVEMNSDHWTADSEFSIPYVQWGMKNPSTFILHVSETVKMNIHAAGSMPAGPQ